MNQAKRQLSVDMLWEDDNKKLRTSNELKSSIEDLSNELIYEIFDYFDAYEIFNQFSNLNQRFRNLILNSNLPLKVHHTSTLPMQRIRHRILSLHVSTLPAIHSSFYRLESLILDGIKPNELVSFLPNLMVLPSLVSLNISLQRDLDDSIEIYRLIFRLPKLKYSKLSALRSTLQDPISITGDEQMSSVEHLVINHPCTLWMLHKILIHTPNLRRLSCRSLLHFPFSGPLPPQIQLRLFNLTHCSIHTTELRFDLLETFLTKCCGQLRVLRLDHARDIAYLDADRWERLISQYMPYLRSFQFRHFDAPTLRFEYQPYHSFIHRFTSSFWIDRGWILNIQTVLGHWPLMTVVYSIQTCHENVSFCEQESMDVSKSIVQWTVRGCEFRKYDQSFIDYLQFICSLADITSLHIEFKYFSLNVLLEFLHRLPTLDSLTIAFTVLNQIEPLTQEQMNMIPKMNNLKRVNIEQMVDLTRIDILTHLCPQMESLQINCRDISDLESIFCSILTNRRSALSSICFRIPNADDSMVTKLRTIINFNNLLSNYTFQRIRDRILLNCH